MDGYYLAAFLNLYLSADALLSVHILLQQQVLLCIQTITHIETCKLPGAAGLFVLDAEPEQVQYAVKQC